MTTPSTRLCVRLARTFVPLRSYATEASSSTTAASFAQPAIATSAPSSPAKPSAPNADAAAAAAPAVSGYAAAQAATSKLVQGAFQASKPEARPRTYGYLIERSAGGNLPVYSEYRNARTNRLTVVRKVSGDVGALRDDIAAYLASGHIDPLTAPPKVYIRPTSQHVEIKGLWVEEIKEWLASKGF